MMILPICLSDNTTNRILLNLLPDNTTNRILLNLLPEMKHILGSFTYSDCESESDVLNVGP